MLAVALPDNQHALSGSVDGTVKLNVSDGAVLRIFRNHGHHRVNSLRCCSTAASSAARMTRPRASPTTASRSGPKTWINARQEHEQAAGARREKALHRSAELRPALRERCRRLEELEADLEAAGNDNSPPVVSATARWRGHRR